MLKFRPLLRARSIGLALIFSAIHPGLAAERQVLPGHVPPAVARLNLQPTGQLPATKSLRLAIGLPLRNRAALTGLIQQLYDPASPNYHRYLTLEQFTEQFGPTEQDYEEVKDFARANGMTVTGTYGNRLVLDVTGPAAAVEKAFHITLRTYRHPTEARDFFAPDVEPSVNAGLPVVDIQGLSDFSRPHPKIHRLDAAQAAARATPRSGSAPDGSGAYFDNDFRNAYAPNTALTGTGQMVGLLEFDGFYSNDIIAYATAAGNGRTNIVIQTVLLDGYNGVPTTGANSGNPEVSLDIEMAMDMAPGLAKIVVFEGNPNNVIPNDVLNSMLSYSNTVKQLSSSWSWGGEPGTTTTNIFVSMMTVGGQSFFEASGDSDAYTTGATSVNGVDNPSNGDVPESCPYITLVGGTTLTNGTGGSYSSETVWNWGVEYGSSYNGVGSSGGISSYYSIPSWQTNISNMASRGGSASFRNIPDVALTADNVYVAYGDGSSAEFGGTSCATPLWAAFIALVNQQAAANGKPSVGFINPAIYAIAAGSSYATCFHDVTTGNNTWSSSPNLFYATNGYDLCTGLGTPNGQNLIKALAPPDSLGITPLTGFTASGLVGGPFSGAPQTFTLTNSSASSLNWSLINTLSWLNFSPGSGVLAGGQQTSVTASLAPAANSLAVGTYSANVWFTNQTTGIAQLRQFALQVLQPLAFIPPSGFVSSGLVGGTFSVTSQNFVLTNMGPISLNWGVINTSSWLNASPAGGTLSADGQTTLTASLTAAASSFGVGNYTATLLVTNQNGGAVSLPFTLQVEPLVQNGGFETGNFNGWTLNGNSYPYNFVTNSIAYNIGTRRHATNITINPHSGTYFAALNEPGALAYLSQNVPTFAGQAYLLSLWMDSPDGETPNEFSVSWNGGTLFDQANLPKLGWTNLQFIVTATGNSTVLQIGARDDVTYLALDDVSVVSIPLVALQPTAVAKANNNLKFSWSAMTGLVYQVQYQTNLLQTNWLALQSIAVTTNTTLSFIDTNAVKASPQRFYRLMLLP